MLDARTVVELFDKRAAESGDAPAIRFREDGRWRSIGWSEWGARSRRIAAGLLLLGIQPGDRVALIGRMCVEWLLTDVAVQMVGGVTVAIYSTEAGGRCCSLVRSAGCRFVFVEEIGQLRKLMARRDCAGPVEKVVVMRPDAEAEVGMDRMSAESLLELGDEETTDWVVRLDDLALTGEEALSQTAVGALETRAAGVRGHDVSTIVFTSGTIEEPKGVLHTHENYLAAIRGFCQALPIDKDDVQLLTLPLAHVRGLVAYRSSVANGSTIALWEGPKNLAEVLGSVRPTFLTAAPYLCEKVFSRVQSEARERGGIEQGLFHWALSVGREGLRVRQSGQQPGRLLALKAQAADRLVLRRVRDLFGGRIRFLIVGGAPLRTDIAELLTVSGVQVLESYGLTESTALSYINRPNRFRLGTVGLPLAGVQAMLAEDGEILLRGATVMAGYDGDDAAVESAVDASGWLKTGDLGRLDDEGFLTVTGRKNDVIVLGSGMKISPGRIEQKLSEDPHISRVLVYGTGRAFLTALITIEVPRVRLFAEEKGIEVADDRELSQHPDVYALIDGAVRALNAQLAPHEQIRKFAILDGQFSTESGEMTPTLKFRRRFTTDKHRALLESFYREAY